MPNNKNDNGFPIIAIIGTFILIIVTLTILKGIIKGLLRFAEENETIVIIAFWLTIIFVVRTILYKNR